MIPLPSSIDNHQYLNVNILDIKMGVIHQKADGIDNHEIIKNIINQNFIKLKATKQSQKCNKMVFDNIQKNMEPFKKIRKFIVGIGGADDWYSKVLPKKATKFQGLICLFHQIY